MSAGGVCIQKHTSAYRHVNLKFQVFRTAASAPLTLRQFAKKSALWQGGSTSLHNLRRQSGGRFYAARGSHLPHRASRAGFDLRRGRRTPPSDALRAGDICALVKGQAQPP